MSSPVAELEAGLLAMQTLRPPGVSGSRIKDITALCVSNVQSESVLIQKIYTHFKKTSGTHKLGVLYVVDSVTRKWMDQAKQQGQAVNSAAPDGTFAAGVHRVTELMPSLMNDILASAPEDQKEKIRKLVDIWEKGQTFPTSMLEAWKTKLNAPPINQSTTPPGSPPPNVLGSLLGSSAQSQPAASAASAAPAVPNIMETLLANIARQNAAAAAAAAQGSSSITTPSVAAPAPAPAATQAAAPAPYLTSGTPSSTGLTPALIAALAAQGHSQPQPQAQAQAQAPSLPFFPPTQLAPAQPVIAPPAMPFQLPPQFQAAVAGQVPPSALPAAMSNPANGFPANPTPVPTLDSNMQQVMLIQTLLAQGIAPETVTTILKSLNITNGATQPSTAPGSFGKAGTSAGSGAGGVVGSWNADKPGESRDRDYGSSHPRSPNNKQRGRSRSRSPGRHWDSHRSPRGRDNDRPYGDSGRGRLDDRERDRGRGPRSDYRQRSPHGQGRRGSSPRRDARHGDKWLEPRIDPDQKWIDHDPTLPNGHIKVLSRTLFVGGVTCSENELRDTFSRFGDVQTCIVNKDKRHAFVKMLTRQDAVKAKDAMEDSRNLEYPLRTRWGVGFGPRECSDYQTGVSVIPIHKLTEADRKWMATAPFGGTGGKPIVTGMVVEEPDIEIGAGVSSKAISRRMQTDRGGAHGPKSSHHEDDGGRGRRRGGREHHHHHHHRRDDDGAGIQPGGGSVNNITVSELPFGLSVGPNGMPIFPEGFKFPAPDEK